MNIRRTTIAILISCFSAFLLMIFLISEWRLLREFESLENTDIDRNISRVARSLNGEMNRLDAFVRDWAFWDDTYSFAEKLDRSYIDSNLSIETYLDQGLSYILFFNQDRRMIYGRLVDLTAKKEFPVPETLLSHFSPDSPFVRLEQGKEGKSSFIQSHHGLFLTASRPILTSAITGPARGTLVVGRLVDQSLVDALSRQTELPLRLLAEPSDSSGTWRSIPETVSPLPAEAAVNNESEVNRISIGFKDIYDTGLLTLHFSTPRDIYLSGKLAIRCNILTIIAMGLVFCIAILILLEKKILSRIHHLGREVNLIAEPSMAHKRIKLHGKDELSDLARHINDMLDTIKDSEEFLRQLSDSLHTGIVLADKESGAIIDLNEFAARMVGRPRQDIVGTPCDDLFLPVNRETAPSPPRDIQGHLSDWKLVTAEKQQISILKTATNVHKKGIDYRLESFADISELQSLQQKLLLSERQYKTIFENTGTACLLIAEDSTILLVNKVFFNITGYESETVMGRMKWWDLVHPDDLTAMKENHRQLIKCKEVPRQYETRLITRRGTTREISINVAKLPGSREVIASIQDITELKRTQNSLTHQAFHDHLTGLPNRQLLMERLNYCMDVADRSEKGLGVLLLDLDRFKIVNDSLGHDKGDNVLVMAAERLRSALRSKDTVARFGGDEFVIIADDAKSTESYAHIAQTLVEAFKAPFKVNGHELHLGVSIGIARYPEDGSNAESLIKNADLAMYLSKERGKNTFSMFTKELNEKVFQKITLESELRSALNSDVFQLHYQPKIKLDSGTICGAEVLLRWPKQGGGMVSPAEFIPLAEETGLIIDIDKWVLEKTCRQIRRFEEKSDWKQKLSVNLSARHFVRGDLPGTIESTLGTTGANSSLLDVELTETALMTDIAAASSVLHKINENGVTISLDDFGTGYSSLHYLQHLPLQTLKIDKKFIDDIGTEKGDLFVRTIIEMARNLDLTVVAEGVEEEKQLEFLRLHGCDVGQGYLFSRPLPLDEFEAFVDRIEKEPLFR